MHAGRTLLTLMFLTGFVTLSVANPSAESSAPSTQSASTTSEKAECDASAKRRYLFSWPITSDCDAKPRGGTTTGGPLTFHQGATEQWQKLSDTSLSKFERDRQAILAMQGAYKVNFDFLETLGFTEDYQPQRPYQSWGTEYVYVVEEQPKFISLQHVMVMVFQKEDGELSEPFVMKHWRQDWTYQDRKLLEYHHNNEWVNRKLPRRTVKGKWSQAVFQVDDSPRYESYGEWQHNDSFSSWKSEKTRRPLPRRESSVRKDYDALEGFNTHVVTRNGWRQVEENWKLKVNNEGKPDSAMPYLAKEQGMARYQPIVDFDFGPGDNYMKVSGQFWAEVRRTWLELMNANASIKLKKTVNGMPVFVPLFDYAQKLVDGKEYKQADVLEFIESTIIQYVDDE